MDTISQIQAIKLNINNMKLQIENLEIKYFNCINSMGMNTNFLSSIGEELLSLSSQILYTGIQSFNAGSNIVNNFKHINELKKISEVISGIINKSNPIMQLQQQMMQQQMMQQQMMQQQMMQQQTVHEKPKINAVFKIQGGIVQILLLKKI